MNPPTSIRRELCDDIVANWPVPLGDAVLALDAAATAHERRDRVVEVLRVAMRLVAGFTLAARLQYGPGPGDATGQVDELVRTLRRRPLTDGQWIALTRELLRPWKEAPEQHPLPGLVALFFGRKKLGKVLDQLLAMRRKETVAHGPTGDEDELSVLLGKRIPQLQQLLERLAPVLTGGTLLVPVDDGARALRLMGTTPHRGRWRRLNLDAPLPVGKVAWVDVQGRPTLALHPIALFAPPAVGDVEEVFWLDGGARRGLRYLALPSMAERLEGEAGDLLDALAAGEDAEHTDPVGRPFRGLSAFTQEDAELFFGRTEEADALAHRVRSTGLVTVTGASGSGKSSLVFAGVVPRLGSFRIVPMRPGRSPLANLNRALATALDTTPEVASDVDAVQALCRDQGLQLVLVVDQAEELLTLADAGRRDAALERIAALGVDTLAPTRVVLCVREDFFARLAAHRALRGIGAREVFVVAPPDRAGLLLTLHEPAARSGYAFEDGLAEAMVDAVEGEPAALALLQFCAARLWERRDRSWKRFTLEAYRALGGVAGALAQHADGVIDGMGPRHRARARRILLQLVTPEATRAVEPWSALVTDDVDESVLSALVGARLLVATEGEEGDALVEVIHEALLKHWARLQGWLAEDADGQRLRHAITQAARDWDRRGRPHGLLWSGDVLAEYRLWAATSGELNEPARSFAAESQRRESRGKWVRRALVGGTVAITSLAAIAFASQAKVVEQARLQSVEQGEAMRALALDAEAERLEAVARPDAALAVRRAALQADAELWATAMRLEVALLHGEAVHHFPSSWGAFQEASPTAGQVLLTHPNGPCTWVDLRTGALLGRFEWDGAPRVDATRLEENVRCRFGPEGELWVQRRLGEIERYDRPGAVSASIPIDGYAHNLGRQGDSLYVVDVSWPEGFDMASFNRARGWLDPAANGLNATARKIDVVRGERTWSTDVTWLHVGTLPPPPISNDGHTLFVGDRALDPANGTTTWSLSQQSWGDFQWLSDRHIATWTPSLSERRRDTRIVDANTGDLVRKLGDVSWLDVSDGGKVAARTEDHLEVFAQLPAEPVSMELPEGTQWTAWAGEKLVLGMRSGAVRIWDPSTGTETRGIEVPDARDAVGQGTGLWVDTPRGSRWIPELGVREALGHLQGTDRHLSVTGERVAWTTGGERAFAEVPGAAVQRSLPAKEAVGESLDLTIAVRLTEPDPKIHVLRTTQTQAPHDLGIKKVVVAESMNGRWFLAGSATTPYARFDAQTGTREPLDLNVPADVTNRIMQASPSGESLLLSVDDKTVQRLPIGQDTPLWEVDLPKDWYAAWVREDRILGFAPPDQLSVIDADSGQTIQSFQTNATLAAAFGALPGHRGLAWLDDELWVIDLDDAAAVQRLSVRTLRMGRDRHADLWASPDGTRLRMITGEGVALIDTERWVEAAFYDGVASAAFVARDQIRLLHQDGRLLQEPLPAAEPASVLRRTGERTNLRVCRKSLEVVPVLPFPEPDSVWAPDELCDP